MKVLVVITSILISMSVFSIGEIRKDLELRNDDVGIRMMFEYHTIQYQGNQNLKIDAYITKIRVISDRELNLSNLSIFLNGVEFFLDCSSPDNECLLYPGPGHKYIYAHNIYNAVAGSYPQKKEIWASFFVNDNFWLENPIGPSTYFKLNINQR